MSQDEVVDNCDLDEVTIFLMENSSTVFRGKEISNHWEMSGDEVEANWDFDDVTISKKFLVANSSTEEQDGSTSNKRQRTSVDPSQVAHGKQVGKVKVKAGRLRQCSTYFDTCMSNRWAQSMTEFHLELHAEMRYYDDCFSRMHYLFKPIRDVAYCIELLKVASQIGFQGVIDMGMKYLAAAPWSDDEEKLVHAFCDSQLVPLDSLTELIARLADFPLDEDDKLSKDSLLAKNLLSDYLQCVVGEIRLPSMTEAEMEQYCSLPHCLEKFEEVFHEIISGAESGVCASVVEHALNLLKQATLTLLSDLKAIFDDAYSPYRGRIIKEIVSILCRLFEIARKSNAAQNMVEVLLNDVEVSKYVLRIGHMDGWNWWTRKWDRTICCIFQDVLEGNLFLDMSQRIALFNQWRWVLRGGILEVGGVHVADLNHLIIRFLTTLPRQKQVEIWKAWSSEQSDDPRCDHGPPPGAHKKWVSYMIMGKAKRQLYDQQERLKFESLLGWDYIEDI